MSLQDFTKNQYEKKRIRKSALEADLRIDTSFDPDTTFFDLALFVSDACQKHASLPKHRGIHFKNPKKENFL